MSFASDPAVRASLVERVKGIILRPSAEWDRIDVEPATVGSLFTGYAMILAAIGPVCSAIGMVVFGVGVPGIAVYHANPIGAVATALVSYVLGLAGVFVLGLIIDALAPTFGGTKNRVQAMKVAVYGSTASWLAGVFGLIPMLGILGILGLYSLYLYYQGLPKLMKTAPDKAMGYTALVVVCAIVLFMVIGLVTAPFRMMGAASAFGTGGVTVVGDGGTVRVGNANLAALAASSKAIEAQAKAIEAQANGIGANGAAAANGAAVVTAAPEALKALLPLSVAGFARGDVSAEGGGIGGMSTSHARAEYAKGDSHMTLEVTDTGGMAALAGLAGALGVSGSKETATGYEKMSTVGGRTISEEYDRQDRSGKYSVMSGRGVVAAEGQGVSMDELKAAAAAVDPSRVAALAKG